MHQSLRSRLLLYYLIVMATILGIFGSGVYVVFRRSLYNQLDKKLLTLAQSATPSFAPVRDLGNKYLNEVEEVPWRDIFNRDQQSLEWFDAKGKLLGRKGIIEINAPPELGTSFIQNPDTREVFRTLTISMFVGKNGDTGAATSVGMIRATQSNEEIETAQSELFWILVIGGMLTLILIGLGGFWLTQKAIEPIEASFLQLKQFTADASHELRSPLTAIKASIDIMRTHPERVHPKDVKKLEAIAGATLQMNEMLGDLLFLARADADADLSTNERKLTPVLLNQILQNCFVLLEPLANEKKIVFQSKFREELKVLGDIPQLSRLFSNLLENALQYTPDEGRVSLDLYRQNRFAVISVRDTGIGIASDQINKVFDRFWRASKARNRREGGTGLGLAISAAIAKRHGGKISVTSEPNIGTCFLVRIPLVEQRKSSVVKV
ncbi:two-component sensor histidine kinase [Pleurocapsa sp. CCALA 161]|uniref:sensor histidine kinase n=1 Tax=Pleurocapsa sp. CCALA 161 TaxID=2107688 RepID=UPI000D0704B2|nr:HAMP domain-containing sensor histidine kinase [Pleurocapsa sp. CCALA 161]PSB07772.1 two-component sensor histidine kinase [Pleurocapsa sp. CCALA 161]